VAPAQQNFPAMGKLPLSTRRVAEQGTNDRTRHEARSLPLRETQGAARRAPNVEEVSQDMNAATGNAKVEAIASVVNELVRERTAMQALMGEMHKQVMSAQGMRRP
jgi:hypothetical protein